MIGLAACALAAVLVAAIWKPAPEDTPIPPPQVLIGETGKPVYGDPIAETKPQEALSPKNVYTLASDDVALVDLGEHWFDGGIIIEAKVQQISISNNATFSYAGLYCCGKFFANPDRHTLDAVTVRLDTVEAGNLPPERPFSPGHGMIDVGRWSPSEDNPWNLTPYGSLLSLDRFKLIPGTTVRLFDIRIEIAPNQTVSAFISNAPLQVLPLADRNAAFDKATLHDRLPAVPAKARFGHNVGLVVQRCPCGFPECDCSPVGNIVEILTPERSPMAATLAETISLALFGTTTPQDSDIQKLNGKLAQIHMDSPANMQKIAGGGTCDIKIETSCCKCKHTINLLDSNSRVVNSCTPVMTCVPAPDGPDGYGVCAGFAMPSADGYYTFEVEVNGAYTTCNTIIVQSPGIFSWLCRFLHIS